MVSPTQQPAHPFTDIIRTLLREELPSLIELRHDLHMHPEIGYEEVRTSGVVLRELSNAGIAHVAGLAGGTGILAHIPPRLPIECMPAVMMDTPRCWSAQRAYFRASLRNIRFHVQ